MDAMDTTILSTPVSVFEVLWGVAIAYFIVRTALLYSALAIATAFLTRLFVTTASRSLGLRIAEHPGFSVSIAHATFFVILARHMMVACGVPRSPTFRLAVGTMTYGLLQLVNAMFGFGPFGDGNGAWGSVSGYMQRIVQIAFVAISLLPVAVMMYERDTAEELKDRKRLEKNVGGSMVKELEHKKIPDGELESERIPPEGSAEGPKGSLLGENERWLLSGL